MINGDSCAHRTATNRAAANGRFRSRWHRAAVLSTVVVTMLTMGAAGHSLGELSTHPNFVDYRTRRYDGVIGQTDWHTCGPAAIATLLKYYFEIETSELEILELALQATDDAERALTNGLNAAALKHAAESKGVAMQGYHLTVDNLIDYFGRGGLPVVLHVTKPRNHYVVAIGTTDGRVALADPSWGRRTMDPNRLQTEKMFSGVALVPLPSADMALVARQHQQVALNDTANQLARLAELQMRLRFE